MDTKKIISAAILLVTWSFLSKGKRLKYIPIPPRDVK
jgi:hypothetical protein